MSLQERNIKKYEEELNERWLPNGQRSPASMTTPEIFDELEKHLLREVRKASGQRRSLWDAMSCIGVGYGDGRMRSHLTELPSLATRLKQSQEDLSDEPADSPHGVPFDPPDKSAYLESLDRVFGKPRGAI